MVAKTNYVKLSNLDLKHTPETPALSKPYKHHDYWSKQERKLWMFGVAWGCMVVYSARVALPICAVRISLELELTKEEQGVALGCFFWGYVLTQIAGGVLADKYGGDKVMTVSGIIWSISTICHPLFLSLFNTSSHRNKFYLLIGLRAITGLFQGVHFPSTSSLLTKRIPPEDRSFFWGVISASSGVGTLTMGSLGSALLDNYGWQSLFYFCGFVGLSWVAFVWFYLLQLQNSSLTSVLLPMFFPEGRSNKLSSSSKSLLHRPLLTAELHIAAYRTAEPKLGTRRPRGGIQYQPNSLLEACPMSSKN